MSVRQRAVREAIDRWAGAAVIDEETAGRLRAIEDEHARAASARLSQYSLAISGAAVLIIAGGVFLEWAWPTLDDTGRTLTLAMIGTVVSIAGVVLEGRGRWTPTSYALQLAGLGLLLSGYIWSERAWPDQSVPATAFGASALLVPILLGGRAFRSGDAYMPAVHGAAGLGFLAVFLDRSTALSGDAIVWVLDVVLVCAIAGLARVLGSDPDRDRYPWALNTFIAAMGSGFVLVFITAAGPLDLGVDTFLALDAWWMLTTALTIWGIERGGTPKYGGALPVLVAIELLAWIGLALMTVRETFDGGYGTVTLLVSGAAVVAFVYADRRAFSELLMASAVAFVAPIWIWAVEAAGALGGIAALVLTAVLLFWAAGRRGSATIR